MIVVDKSALIAILDKEPDANLYAEAIAEAGSPLISTATLVELNMVMLNRHGIKAAHIVDRLIQEGGFQVKSFTIQTPNSRVTLTLAMAMASNPPALTTGTVFPTRWRKLRVCRYSSKGRIFQKPILSQCSRTLKLRADKILEVADEKNASPQTLDSKAIS